MLNKYVSWYLNGVWHYLDCSSELDAIAVLHVLRRAGVEHVNINHTPKLPK